MSDEHDSWLQSAFGLDVGQVVQKVEDVGAAAVSQVTTAVADVVAPAPAPAAADSASPAPPPAAASYISAPGILGTLGNIASDVGHAVVSTGSKALEVANDAGNAINSAESSAWDATKGAYTAATNAYDSVAPNFTQASQDLNKLVDAGEAAARKGNDQLVAQYGDVPVLGSLAKASAWVGNVTTEAGGGIVKGVGDLAAMGGNAVFHPIDAAESLGEGVLGIAEHVPSIPGANTTVKGIHGLVDLARGKTDGNYGATLGDLGENLLMNTQQDPNDPSQRVNTDTEFLAGMGGGTKAWADKPAEAATRTITNLLPMLLGDEAAGGKPPPEIPPEVPPTVPELPPAARPVDPFAKTEPSMPARPPAPAVDPMAKTQPDIRPDGPKTEVDPPRTEPEAPPPDGPQVPEQIRQNLVDASAAQKAAEQASFEATQEYVRYRNFKPNPARDWPGEPEKWDPVTDEALHDQMLRAQQENTAAINRLRDAQKAARDAAGRAKGGRGGGGFPPPRS